MHSTSGKVTYVNAHINHIHVTKWLIKEIMHSAIIKIN